MIAAQQGRGAATRRSSSVLPAAKSSAHLPARRGRQLRAVLDGKARTARRSSTPATTPSGKLVGFAIQAQGMGYQDVIARALRLLAGSRTPSTGFRVLETTRDAGPRRQDRLRSRLPRQLRAADGRADARTSPALVHPIEVVKHGAEDAALADRRASPAPRSPRARWRRSCARAPPSGRRSCARTSTTSGRGDSR